MSAWMTFALAVFTTWRVTHLLASEDGPADIIVRLRSRMGDGPIGRAMDCFHCLSLWVAAPTALLLSWRPLDWVMSWLALSGAACLLERLGKKPLVAELVSHELQGDDDVLRQKAISLE